MFLICTVDGSQFLRESKAKTRKGAIDATMRALWKAYPNAKEIEVAITPDPEAITPDLGANNA